MLLNSNTILCDNCRQPAPKSSVVDPKLLFSDPDPALGLISDPDPDSDPDPACLTKIIRLYLICPQESIAQRFSSHFRR
jgi:hypothetical protein